MYYHFNHLSCFSLAILSGLTIASAADNSTGNSTAILANPGTLVLDYPFTDRANYFAVNDTIEITWDWGYAGNWTFGLIAGEDGLNNTGTGTNSHDLFIVTEKDPNSVLLATKITVNSSTKVGKYNYTFPAFKGIDYGYQTTWNISIVYPFPNATVGNSSVPVDGLKVDALVGLHYDKSDSACSQNYVYDVQHRTVTVADRGHCPTSAAGRLATGSGLLAVVAAVAFSTFLV